MKKQNLPARDPGTGTALRGHVQMFVAQGVAQYEIWTGGRAPEAVMRAAVVSVLAREESERKAQARK